MDLPRSQTMSAAYASVYGEGFKPFPKNKVQDKAAMKPDTARGEKQARNMDNARMAHTDKDIAPIAKGAVKEREQDNKKTGLEKRFAAPSAKKNKNKAYELEGQRRRDLDKRYGTKKEEYLAMRDMYSSVYSEQSVETPVVNETVENDDEVTYLDVVANHLFEGGYALNGESAYAMANHISEDYFNQICEDVLDEGNADQGVSGDQAMERHGIKPHEGTMKVTKLKPRGMRKGEGLGVGARKRQGAGKPDQQGRGGPVRFQ